MPANFNTMTDHDIIAFYREKNKQTEMYHWQHMAEDRMLAILKKIATNGRKPEDRKEAAKLALEIFNYKSK